MTEAVTTTPDRPKRRSNSAMKRDKVRMVADDVVTPNSLATHFGCTRQNIARLTAEAVIEQRSDGHYDQTASRLRYIQHLREQHRHTPRSAADAAHVAVKTEMLQLRLINIPATPHKVYVDDGWVGIGDWLGTGRIAPGQFRSFDEARTFARGLGLKSAAEWYAFSKSGNKPTDIPIWPHASYRHVGWAGMGDWQRL